MGGANADFATMNELFHPDHVFMSLGATKLGEGKAVGGADLDQRFWLLMEVAAAKIVRTVAYTEPSEALKAALQAGGE
jgi:ketosteroid isomerase-like protein